MEDQITTNIIIDDEGRKQVLKTFALFKNLALLYLAWAALFMIRSIFSYLKYADRPLHLWFNIFNFRLIPALNLLHVALGITSYFFHYTAYKMQKTGLYTGDSILFIRSYKVFRKGMYLTAIISGIALMETGLFLFHYDINIM